MRYVGEGLSCADKKKGYVYHSTEYGGNSAVICHNPYLFHSNGSFNFDVPDHTIIVLFRIKKRSLLSRFLYITKKLLK